MNKKEWKKHETKRRLEKAKVIADIKSKNEYWLFDHFTNEQLFWIRKESVDLIKIECIDDRDAIDLQLGMVYEIPAFCFDLRNQLIVFSNLSSYNFGRFKLAKE